MYCSTKEHVLLTILFLFSLLSLLTIYINCWKIILYDDKTNGGMTVTSMSLVLSSYNGDLYFCCHTVI